jgi:hypothetical protein
MCPSLPTSHTCCPLHITLPSLCCRVTVLISRHVAASFPVPCWHSMQLACVSPADRFEGYLQVQFPHGLHPTVGNYSVLALRTIEAWSRQCASQPSLLVHVSSNTA